MAPTSSMLAWQKKQSSIETLLELLRQRMKLKNDMLQLFSDEMKKKKTLRKSKTATFRFFSAKIDFLFRRGKISEVVGVSFETFNKVLNLCKQRTSKIDNKIRVAIFLKFCREGQSQKALSRDVGLSQPTVSRIVVQCIKDLKDVAREYIKFPKEKNELREMQEKFLRRKNNAGIECGVPCIGVLDGKHWRIDRPPHTGSLNYNYKAFFSFNSLFLCDADGRIIFVQLSTLGVNSDAQIFNDGTLSRYLQRAANTLGLRILPNSNVIIPSFCLADNGFGLSKHIMTPYRANQLRNSDDIRFNELISATRVKIENVFGILCSKFQVFARNLRLDPKNFRALIIACCVIHNISIGQLQAPPKNFEDEPVVADPYPTAEAQRTALKTFMLSR